MKNYYKILMMFFVSLNINGQTLEEGMNLFTNTYSIKYVEPYTDFENYDVWEPGEVGGHSRYLKDPCVENSSVKFKESVDKVVLNNLVSLIKENPASLLPYFDSDTHKFSAFVLFLYTYEIRAESCSISSFFNSLWLFNPEGELSVDAKNKFPLLTDNEILLHLWDSSSTIKEAKQMFVDFLKPRQKT